MGVPDKIWKGFRGVPGGSAIPPLLTRCSFTKENVSFRVQETLWKAVGADHY